MHRLAVAVLFTVVCLTSTASFHILIGVSKQWLKLRDTLEYLLLWLAEDSKFQILGGRGTWYVVLQSHAYSHNIRMTKGTFMKATNGSFKICTFITNVGYGLQWKQTQGFCGGLTGPAEYQCWLYIDVNRQYSVFLLFCGLFLCVLIFSLAFQLSITS